MNDSTSNCVKFSGLALALALSAACTTAPARLSADEPRGQVTARETAFAATMAARDFEAFSAFVADDAVFMSGDKPLQGKAAVLAAWRPLFAGSKAPFSWHPELVIVVGAGDLAETNGPVFTSDGKLIAHFRSTWRRDAHGVWHIELDNGYDECSCAASGAK
jgi:ketosteroid isomerase-like protein